MKAWLPALLRLALVVLLVAFLTNPGWFEPLLKPLLLLRYGRIRVYSAGVIVASTSHA